MLRETRRICYLCISNRLRVLKAAAERFTESQAAPPGDETRWGQRNIKVHRHKNLHWTNLSWAADAFLQVNTVGEAVQKKHTLVYL